jgi:hypothetical protein
MARPGTNYWVDVAIGVGFAASALSGAIFLLPGGVADGVLGLSLGTWSTLHTWSSLLLIAGVAAHLGLHGRWIAHMTRRQLGGLSQARQQPRTPCPIPPLQPADQGLSRRSFLALTGAGLMASGLLAGAGALVARWLGATGSFAAGVSPSTGGAWHDSTADRATGDAPTATAPLAREAEARPTAPAVDPSYRSPDLTTTVACRHGYVNDPYPGECRHYVDRDGDGICDQSVPGSAGSRSLGG